MSSYDASGYGEIKLVPDGIPQNVMAELDEMDCFEFGDWQGNNYLQFYGGFYSDYVEEYLHKIAPYVESGSIEMTGDDGSHWKYKFEGGRFAEYAGHIVYSDERCKPLALYNQRKLEFLRDIIEVFENFLDDRGITIDNPDKEEDESVSNIYGTDYGDLESEIEYVLKKWEVL